MRQKRCTAWVAAGPIAQRVKSARSRRSSRLRREVDVSTCPKIGSKARFGEARYRTDTRHAFRFSKAGPSRSTLKRDAQEEKAAERAAGAAGAAPQIEVRRDADGGSSATGPDSAAGAIQGIRPGRGIR